MPQRPTHHNDHQSNPNIHPSAIIDPAATIHPSTTIGPNTLITGQVTIGPNNTIHNNVSLKGPLTLDSHNTLHTHVTIGYEPQDRKFNPSHPGAGTTIGSHNTFHQNVTIHRATSPDQPTTIGNHNTFHTNSHAGHDVQISSHCTLHNGALLAGHVTLESHATLDEQAVVHQFCRVGRFTRLLQRTAITQDAPPFTIAPNRSISGLNIPALQQANLADHIPNLRQAFDIIYKQQRTTPHAAQQILKQFPNDPLCTQLAEFLQTTQRGICSFNQP